MRKIILLLLISFSKICISQNVGINATGAAPNSSAMLDVAATNKGVSFPNVNLLSETDAVTITSPMPGLMVYNTNAAMPCATGLYFNDGTAASPVWTCFNKTVRHFHAYDAAGRTNVNSNVLTLQPGCTINFTIPAGQTADVKIDALLGGTNVSTTAGQYSLVDVVIFLDGTFLAQGGWDRTSCINPSGTNTNGFFTSTLTTWANNVTAGAHTLQLMASRNAGTSAVNLGGNCATTTNCGEIHAAVFYK